MVLRYCHNCNCQYKKITQFYCRILSCIYNSDCNKSQQQTLHLRKIPKSPYYMKTPTYFGSNMVISRSRVKCEQNRTNNEKQVRKYSEKWYNNVDLRNFKHRINTRTLVGIAIRYGLDGPENKLRFGRSFPYPSRSTLGPTQSPIQWVPVLSRG
jgi:hypothetical protein